MFASLSKSDSEVQQVHGEEHADVHSGTRRKTARAESRWSDEEMRWARLRLISLGERGELVLSRWDIQVTRLRGDSPQRPACLLKTTDVKRRPFRWHRLAVSWIVRLKVLGGNRRGTWVPCGRTETRDDRKVPGFRNHVFPMARGRGWLDVEGRRTLDGLGTGLRFSF